MRTVYLGTSDFAARILTRLAATEHRPQLVVTRPDRPAGRGRTLTPPPVATVAADLGIEVIQPEQLDDEAVTQQVIDLDPEGIVVCAYGAIIREPLLSATTIYNVHPSLLPRWRGAAPIERSIAAGDAETGVSIMQLEAGLDSGPVALQEAIPIGPEDTYGSVAERLLTLSGDLLLRALDEHPAFIPQPEDGITYAEKITAADRTLDPAAPAIESDRMIRALTPHIGARLPLEDGSFLGIQQARVLADVADEDQLVIDADLVRVGALELLRVQPPGGKPMDAASWARGRR